MQVPDPAVRRVRVWFLILILVLPFSEQSLRVYAAAHQAV
jgi:hypothetical protein